MSVDACTLCLLFIDSFISSTFSLIPTDVPDSGFRLEPRRTIPKRTSTHSIIPRQGQRPPVSSTIKTELHTPIPRHEAATAEPGLSTTPHRAAPVTVMSAAFANSRTSLTHASRPRRSWRTSAEVMQRVLRNPNVATWRSGTCSPPSSPPAGASIRKHGCVDSACRQGVSSRGL